MEPPRLPTLDEVSNESMSPAVTPHGLLRPDHTRSLEAIDSEEWAPVWLTEEDDEKVECPKMSRPSTPGVQMLGHEGFLQDPPDRLWISEELAELRRVLEKQHEEVVRQFREQRETILQNVQMPDFVGRVRSLASSAESGGAATMSCPPERPRRPSTTSTTGLRPRRNSQMSNNGRPPTLVPSLPSPTKSHRATFTPKLFSSLTRVDEELRSKAAQVDADKAAASRKSEKSFDALHRPSICQRIVQTPAFDVLFAFLILTNAVFIGVEVQWGLDHPHDEDHWLFQWGRNIYTILFSLELFMRLGAQGKLFLCGEDRRWNCLDSIIVIASWWEAALEIQLWLTEEGSRSNFAGITGIRTLRIVRITRLVKVARLARFLRFVMALRTLTQSIIYTLKSLIWAMVLLLLIVYSFGILFTQVVADIIKEHAQLIEQQAGLAAEQIEAKLEAKRVGEQYFGSLWKSMVSLYMSIAGGVSWEQVLVPLEASGWIWVIAFIFYIAFSTLAVLNVVTGVFCQSAIESAQSDHDMVIQSILNNKEAHIEKIKMLFTEIDAAESGVITFQMFQERIMSQEVQTYFESIDLDVWDAWTFFKLLDMDAGGAVEIEEFLLGCLRLRGNAKAMDIAKLCHDQTWLIREQARFWEFVESELYHMQVQMTSMTGQRTNSR